MSEIPQQTDIPLELINDERRLKGRLAKLEEEITELEARQQSLAGSSEPAPQKPSRIPFTNREDEMKSILSATSPAYHLLYGPTGYGKTELLVELKRRFEEREWYCAYVALSENSSDKDLIDGLAEQFRISISTRNNEPLSWQIGRGLVQMWEGGGRKEGLVLLIDLEKVPSIGILHKLIEIYIPNIESSLRRLVDFEAKHNRFRVIIAGRNLGLHLKAGRQRLPLTLLRLSPFDYEVIRISATDYLFGYNQPDIDQLSAHLFFITGGHPGCMAHTLQMYKDMGMPPDEFLNHFGGAIWRDVIRDCIESTFNEIPPDQKYLLESLERVSVFRQLDYRALGEFSKDLIPADHDEYHLADTLTAKYLLERQGRLLTDAIARRLLAVKLRNEAPQEFPRRCEQAIRICEDRLRQPSVKNPETWTVEYLYQSLQCHALYIQEPEERAKMRSSFPEQVRSTLEIFYDRDVLGDKLREEKEALMQVIREDWEFRFTVNYYLRDNNYNEEPCKKMEQQIDTFFA